MKRSLVALLLSLAVVGCQPGDEMTSTGETEGQLFAMQQDFGGAHILVAYQGAMRADPSVTRTKEEALEKAKGLIVQLSEDPDLFGDLARAESDGPSGESGGDLGFWMKGQMVPAFDEAIEQLEVGAVTQEPVETDFGFHVIRRNSTLVAHYGADGFVINYVGAAQTLPGVTRTKEQADSLAEVIKSSLNADNFDELALEYNDAAEGKFFMGGFPENDDNIDQAFMDGLKEIGMGEVAGPFEFPIGLIFARRVSLDQRSGAHILVSYLGAERADGRISRSKEEARARALELIAELKADPGKFEELAMQHSDGPSGPQGGDLGVWFRGRMVEEFDIAIDDLDVGDITDEPVETPFGFHIIQRKSTASE